MNTRLLWLAVVGLTSTIAIIALLPVTIAQERGTPTSDQQHEPSALTIPTVWIREVIDALTPEGKLRIETEHQINIEVEFKELERLLQALESSARHIEKAADALDPLGVKEMTRTIRSLQQANRELEARIERLQSYPAAGIDLRKERLLLIVEVQNKTPVTLDFSMSSSSGETWPLLREEAVHLENHPMRAIDLGTRWTIDSIGDVRTITGSYEVPGYGEPGNEGRQVKVRVWIETRPLNGESPRIIVDRFYVNPAGVSNIALGELRVSISE